jgi:rare lipoprotein A
MGKYYYPTYVKVGDSMRGIASWYGPKFHGKITSSGERYNMYGITVAHKTWPMHTMVRVTNLDNGKSIIARINDRGPFVKGRIVDCSYGVAKKLDIVDKGTCNVRLDVVGFNGKLYRANSNKRDIKSKVKLNNFGVQVGAFTVLENAKKHKEKYKKVVSKPYYVKIKRTTQHSTGRELYRVLVMGFNSKEEAENFIYRENITGGFVILGD